MIVPRCGSRRHRLRHATGLLAFLALTFSNTAGPGVAARAVTSLPSPHVTFITPIWTSFIDAPDAEVAANVATLRARIGEGGGVKLGFAAYLEVLMDDWRVDTSSPTDVRRALGAFESQVDEGIRRARAHNVVFVVTLLTAIRDRTDPAQRASYDDDRRVMQWYADNTVADGWWTHSRYARRQYAVQRAYMQEVAKILASRVAQYPETLVGIAGDGEVELAYLPPRLADYSPFAVAEFRDWARAEGLYAPGAEFGSEAYALATRYRGDVTPAADSNEDGHTLNGDMGTQFNSWDLRYFPWSLADDERSDQNAIPKGVYSAAGFNPMPGGAERAFDPPRTWDPTSPWCQLWNQFRQTMVWHHNKDLARWMTTTPDSLGRRLPSSRWFSYQIPSDYVFGSSPEEPSGRSVTSASPWWTANVAPYGGLGFTAFGARPGTNTYQRTLPGLLAGIRSCGSATPAPPRCLESADGLAGTPWGIFEWNPVVPLGTGSSSDGILDHRYDRSAEQAADAPPPEPTDLAIYRDEVRRLRRYRPTILAPFLWGNFAEYRILNTGFETAMREFAAVLRDGWTPTVQASPATLHVAARREGRLVVSRSAPQTVYVSQPTGGTVDWSVTAGQTWLALRSASGHGDGSFTVDVDPDKVVTLPAGVHTCVVTLAAPGSIPEQVTLSVTLTVFDAVPTRPPFGVVDTPLQDSMGIVGAFGITGWALDDVGVTGVKIYRNCLSFEPLVNCAVVKGRRVVFVGDATLVAGARPDVEASFPSYPLAYRAGWGYLLLSNMLPHIPRGQMFGGQGKLTFYALATDVEGQQTWLGRTTADSTPTTITLANDTITKPFGAIDTPGQGHTISGRFANFGWVLTPDSNTERDAGDIVVPTTGASIWVWVDGVPLAPISYYNLCRGTVGSPVPAGRYCDDDVANIFGQVTPQPMFTARTANTTVHRNLDADRGAMGAYFLDTTSLPNGVHSIVWSVADSAGREEGIGSRYFTVLNAGAAAAAADAPARIVGEAADVTWRPVGAGTVWGRAGFVLRASSEIVEPDSAGTRHVRMPEMGRLELSLGPGVTAGYLMVNGTLRALPVGSQVTDGHFTWAPPVGYLGAYELVFLNGIEQVPVTVTIHAASERSRTEAYIDLPRAGETVSGPFTIAGWAADPTAWTGTGIGAVHVWAHRRDRADLAPLFLGAAELGIWRPDVGAQLGPQFERAGWQLVAPALPPGEYDLVAYFWSPRTQRFEDARATIVTAR